MRVSAITALYVCATALQVSAQEYKLTENADRSWATLQARAALQFNSGLFADALQTFEAALPLATAAEQRATTMTEMGYSLSGLGRHVEAIAQLERSLAAWRDIDPAGPDAVKCALSLARAQESLNQYSGAERTLRTVLEARPRDNESVAAVLNALGGIMNRQARLAQARDSFAAALKVSAQHSENRASALIGLADFDRCMRRWQAGIRRSNDALALARDVKNPALEAVALLVLADIWSDTGDDARAEPLLKRALAIFEKTSSGGPQIPATLTSLGVVYAHEGKNALAEDAFRRALSGDASAPNSFDARALECLAVLLSKVKRFDEAGEFANRAYGIARSVFGEDNPRVASALGAMALVEERAGNPDKAEQHYAEALRIMRKNGILDSSGGLELMTREAILLRKLHRGREAKSVNAELKTFRSAAQPAH